jgi:hypothetical protein
MIYRMRTYQVVPENLERFDDFFETDATGTTARNGHAIHGRHSLAQHQARFTRRMRAARSLHCPCRSGVGV